MAPSARGADLSTALPFAVVLLERSPQRLWEGGSRPPVPRVTNLSGARGHPRIECPLPRKLLFGWGERSARRVRAVIPPEAAGTRRVDRGWGIGDAVSCGHREDPGPRRAAGSQPEESRHAANGGEQAPSGRAPAGLERNSELALRNENTATFWCRTLLCLSCQGRPLEQGGTAVRSGSCRIGCLEYFLTVRRRGFMRS
jgi:hypothetical protein